MKLSHSNRGSALIMSMIFLVVLTVAGVTAMRFASLEENMAANSQAQAYVFQQAQSEIQTQLHYFGTAAGLNRLNTLDLQHAPKESVIYLPPTASRRENLAAVPEHPIKDIDDRKIRFIRDGMCGDGSSVEQFICIDYELEIETKEKAGAKSEQTQGFTFKNLANGN